jgi:peptide/nickel transport system substrate-binding protein
MESTGPISGWVIGAPRYMERVGWDEFLKYPVGTGPYMVQDLVNYHAEVSEGEVYATLLANPKYWNRGYPKIRKVTFIKHSPQEALRALIEGQIDLATNLIPKDTLKVAESPISKVVKGREDVTYTMVNLNLMSPHTLPLRDMRVRKALNYAVNKEELLRYAYKGNAVVMKGVLTERSRVDISRTETYERNIPKARQLLKEAGYAEGFKMKVFYHEKDYLLARLLVRFYSLLKIEFEMTPVDHEWGVKHIAYPNTSNDYSWENEKWWMWIYSTPCHVPEAMGGYLEWFFRSKGAWRTAPDWVLLPLDRIYQQLLRTKDQEKRFEIYREANEYIADQALWVFTVAPLSLYGVNEEVEFIPQPSQCLYLDYSSVTDSHWSIRGKNN